MAIKYDVFLSKNTKDHNEVEKLLSFLENAGLHVFESQKSLPKLGLADYAQAIDNALELSQNLIVLCSTNELATGEGKDSSWVYYEWTLFRNELLSKRKNGNLITVLCNNVTINMLPVGLRKYQSFELDNIEISGILDYFKNNEEVTSNMDISSNKKNTVAIDLKMFDFGYHFSLCMFAKMQKNNSFDNLLQADLDELEMQWKDKYQILSANLDEITEEIKKSYGEVAADVFSLGQYCGICTNMALFVVMGAEDVLTKMQSVFIPYIRIADSLGIAQSVIEKLIAMIEEKDQERITNYHKLVRRAVALRNETSCECPFCGAATTIETTKCYNCKSKLK